MRTTHMFGLILWRGGLLLVASYGFFRWARWFLELLEILPRPLEIGVGLILSGLGMLFVSVVMERIVDYRKEQEEAS